MPAARDILWGGDYDITYKFGVRCGASAAASGAAAAAKLQHELNATRRVAAAAAGVPGCKPGSGAVPEAPLFTTGGCKNNMSGKGTPRRVCHVGRAGPRTPGLGVEVTATGFSGPC